MAIVLFVVLMDVVGIGIIAPLFPFYAMRVGATPGMVSLCMSLYTAALFVSAPILGRLSDSYGRKPIMAISLIGSIAGYGMLIMADNLWLIALSRILGGAMAGNFGAAQAYLADHSDDANRAKIMGSLGATMGLGYVFGPVLGSWLGGHSFEQTNFMLPALTAAGLSAAGLLGLLLFVKEDRTPKTTLRTSARESRWPRLRQLLKTSRDGGGRGALLVKIAAIIALYQTASGLYESIFPIWAADHALVQGPNGLLPIFLAGGVGFVLIQAVIGKIVQPRRERRVLIAGGALYVLATGAMTVAGDFGSAIGATLLTGLTACAAGLVLSTAQIALTRCTRPETRGFVLGSVSSVGMLGRTIAVAGSGFIYTGIAQHAPYYFAVLLGVVICLIGFSLKRENEDVQAEPADEPGPSIGHPTPD